MLLSVMQDTAPSNSSDEISTKNLQEETSWQLNAKGWSLKKWNSFTLNGILGDRNSEQQGNKEWKQFEMQVEGR